MRSAPGEPRPTTAARGDQRGRPPAKRGVLHLKRGKLSVKHTTLKNKHGVPHIGRGVSGTKQGALKAKHRVLRPPGGQLPGKRAGALYLGRGGLTLTALPYRMAQARIPIPTAKDAPAVLRLTAAVAAGISKAGKDALIGGQLATELQAAAAKVPTALALHQRAKDLERELESLYEQRDAIVAECLPLVQRGSKTLQGNLGKANLRQMGDYGYTVDDSPRPAKS